MVLISRLLDTSHEFSVVDSFFQESGLKGVTVLSSNISLQDGEEAEVFMDW